MCLDLRGVVAVVHTLHRCAVVSRGHLPAPTVECGVFVIRLENTVFSRIVGKIVFIYACDLTQVYTFQLVEGDAQSLQ